MGKPSAPPTPDYVGAANATAAGNQEAARVGVKGNRVDQYGPYGNIVYTPGIGGDQDRWRMDTTLSPLGQEMFDQNQSLQSGLLGIANQGLGKAGEIIGQPAIDNSLLPQQSVNPGQTGQEAIMSRLRPEIDRQNAQLEARLVGQGLRPGGEAYDTEQRLNSQRQNDLMLQAASQGIGIGQQARQQGIQEQAFSKQFPINIINALRSGNQVQMPTFQNVPGQQTVAGPDILGATMAQGQAANNAYNQQVAGSNALMGGLFNLGGTAMSTYFSDRRLKSNVERVGTHPLGIGVYEYDIYGIRQRGVMADEVETVMPDAVSEHPSGYKMVRYSLIGSGLPFHVKRG